MGKDDSIILIVANTRTEFSFVIQTCGTVPYFHDDLTRLPVGICRAWRSWWHTPVLANHQTWDWDLWLSDQSRFSIVCHPLPPLWTKSLRQSASRSSGIGTGLSHCAPASCRIHLYLGRTWDAPLRQKLLPHQSLQIHYRRLRAPKHGHFRHVPSSVCVCFPQTPTSLTVSLH